MTDPDPAGARALPYEVDVVAYPPAARIAVAALQVCSRGSLLVLMLWILGPLAFLGDPPTNTLRQMRLFAAWFAAPEALAWLLRRAFASKALVAADSLTIRRGDQSIEVPLAAVSAVEPWRVPLPRGGFDLRLRSGRRLSPGLQVADAVGLVDAMVASGASASLRAPLTAATVVYAQARLANPPTRLDHPVFKFVVYSLVPTLPVFRLHQFITYGGTFGEYLTFGLKAYLLAFALWWVSFAMGLAMFAAGLRALVEAAALLAATVAPSRAGAARRFLERFQRAVYFVGMPVWLALRLLA